jgi:hypothetical protein
MFKPAALALGLLTVLMVVSGSRSFAVVATTTVSTDQIPAKVWGNLHAEKLLPLKQSTSLKKTAIEGKSVKSPTRPPALSREQQENQRIKTACQREFDDRYRFGSNERSVGILDNSSTTKTGSTFGFNSLSSYHQSTYTSDCNFSGKF